MDVMKGTEHFFTDAGEIDKTVTDFWAWYASDLLSNILRGALSEFIVATALGIDTKKTRVDWEAYDLQYGEIRIEVKSSAYLQSWEQKFLSKLRFSIAPALIYDWDKNTYAGDLIRRSDFYVFCVFTCLNRSEANLLSMNQWQFYVLPTEVLNEKCGG
ncbi:MAG: hypothetical protein J1F68_01395 [Clostridiales bacterium]|nr:hypothetical protein [Clostridiales bacterium]